MASGILISLILSLFLVIWMALLGMQSTADEEKARARRMAEHRMNARLLRFNI